MLAWLGSGLTLPLHGAPAAGDVEPGRVVVLGFGGADARLVEQWMAEGDLPHLAGLANAGGYARLTPTLPAQDEASWAAFATGRDPGDSGLFDVVARDPASYQIRQESVDRSLRPFLWGDRNGAVVLGIGALGGWLLGFVVARVLRRRGAWLVGLAPAMLLGTVGWWAGTHWLPNQVSEVTSRRRGTPFWEVAGDAGIAAVVARLPACYPPRPWPGGRLLAGLGVPDARDTVGTPTLYTMDPQPLAGGDLFPVEVIALDPGAKRIATLVPGPPDPLDPGAGRVDAPLVLEVSADAVTLDLGGRPVSLGPGDWSPWLPVDFAASPVFTVHALARFRLLGMEPLELYLEPLQLDPSYGSPSILLSSPQDFAAELAAAVGPFKTAGWAVDTWGVAAGAVSEDVFLEDLVATSASFRRLLAGFLAGDDQLLVQYFEFPDRAGHIFGAMPPTPAPVAAANADAGSGERLLGVYRTMDDVVGQVLASLAPDDVLLVLSDHGMTPFRRSFDLNAWLRDAGYLAAAPAKASSKPWVGVDWEHTRAYAVGFGGLYLNLRGREGRGIVAPGEEYESLRRQLARSLEAMEDPDTGEHPVARVVTREEVWGSFDAVEAPDLVVTTRPGYRLAWAQLAGEVQGPVLADNTLAWRGDHASADPESVPGVLFANRPLDQQRVRMLDVYPTILGLLGLTPPETGRGVAFMRRDERR